jgi:hypothetical protein
MILLLPGKLQIFEEEKKNSLTLCGSNIGIIYGIISVYRVTVPVLDRYFKLCTIYALIEKIIKVCLCYLYMTLTLYVIHR